MEMPSQIPAFRRTVALQMEAYRERLAQRVSSERQRRGLQPRDIAYEIGVDKRTFERWEAGEVMPQPRHLKALADYFDVRVEELRPDLEAEERALRAQLDRIETKLDLLITGLGLTDETDPIREATAIAAATERQHAETAPTATATKKPKATPARPS